MRSSVAPISEEISRVEKVATPSTARDVKTPVGAPEPEAFDRAITLEESKPELMVLSLDASTMFTVPEHGEPRTQLLGDVTNFAFIAGNVESISDEMADGMRFAHVAVTFRFEV
jgi:hypothetical protein